MARRINEAIALSKEGIELDPLGTPKTVEKLKDITVHKTFKGVFSLQFNYDGKILAVGYGAGGVQLYDSSTGLMMKEVIACRHGGPAIMALRFSPKEEKLLFAASTDGIISCINIESGERVGTIEETGNEINTLDFCLDGYNFATGGRDFDVRVYDTKTLKLSQHYKGYSKSRPAIDKDVVSNTMRIFSMKFHPNNEYVFISGGWDNQLKIWDTRANDGIKRSISGPHICGDAIDMKGNNILSGQWVATRALQEHDYTDGKVVKELNYPHKDGAFLYSAQYCNDDLVVAGGSGTNRAELIEISSNTNVGGFDLGSPIQAIDSTLNGRLIAVGGSTNTFHILQVSDKIKQKTTKK